MKQYAFIKYVNLVGMLTILTISIIGVYWWYAKSQSKISSSIQPSINAPVKITPHTIIHLSKLYTVITPDEVIINAFENTEIPGGLIIKKLDYPKIFEAEFIQTEDFLDKENNKYFIIVSSNYSRSGGFMPWYFLIVDPGESKIVYKSPNEFNSASDRYYEIVDNNTLHLNMAVYNLYSDCMNCKLTVDEFVAYNKATETITPVNGKYKTTFSHKLNSYVEMENKESCKYKGETLSLGTLISKYGQSATCNSNSGTKFMSVGEYLNYKEKIQQIVNGTRESLLTP